MHHPAPKPDHEISLAINALAENCDIRVWSLIVSLFGDMARAKGDWLSGAALSQITTRIGIKPEAMRVALHRLRKDGWITSNRVGRSSQYALTAFGRDEAAQAAQRIYAAQPDVPAAWHLLVCEPKLQSVRLTQDQDLIAQGYVSLTPGTYLGKGDAPARTDSFVVTGGVATIPDWVKSTLMPARLIQDYAVLEQVLTRVQSILDANPVLDQPDIVTLRTLLVHNWRRLLLRHADLPPRFFPEACRCSACRDVLQSLLARLPRPALGDADQF